MSSQTNNEINNQNNPIIITSQEEDEQKNSPQYETVSFSESSSSSISCHLCEENSLDKKEKKSIEMKISQNTFFSFEPMSIDDSSLIEIAIFNKDINDSETKLSYHLEKNENNEIFIWKHDLEINEDNKNENNEKEGIKNIYKFVCCDINCNAKAFLAVEINKSNKNNYDFIFNKIIEHNFHKHSYNSEIENITKIFINKLKNNPKIKNLQLINVPNNFDDNSCFNLGKNSTNIIPTITIHENNNNYRNKKYNMNLRKTLNLNEETYEEESDSDFLNITNDAPRKIKKMFDDNFALSMKRSRKKYNCIKQKDYTFIKSKNSNLVYAEEHYSRGKEAKENSNARQNWFSYIHKKYGPRTRLGPHFHKSEKENNRVYKYVIKHLLTGFGEKTLNFYCPLAKCSGKGVFNLKDETFIQLKEHDISYENHCFRSHKLIDDYFEQNENVTDIQVLRTLKKC